MQGNSSGIWFVVEEETEFWVCDWGVSAVRDRPSPGVVMWGSYIIHTRPFQPHFEKQWLEDILQTVSKNTHDLTMRAGLT